ncbi:MAG: HAD family hydrolase, partial [Acutalibacteraceae bacterium]
KERNLAPLPSKEFYLENFDFPIIDFYHLIGYTFETETYDEVAEIYAVEYEKRLETTSLFPDVKRVLDALEKRGFKQVIISATEQNMLLSQVDRYGISKYFESVLGTSNKLGQSKVQTAVSWLSENGIDPKTAVFIGDTLHDLETARAIGCDCILTSRGHFSKKRLLTSGCPVADSLDEVLERLMKE